MLSLMKGNGWRTALLNAVLLVALAAAWISDRWPSLALPAISIAFAAVAGEIAILFMLAKNNALRKQAHSGIADTSRQLEEMASAATLALAQTEQTGPVDISADLLRWHLLARKFRAHAALRARADDAAAQFLFHFASKRDASDELTIRRALLIRQSRGIADFHQHRQLPPELLKWKIVSSNHNEFNVDAGAFAIEHFQGQTNIRVLDSSRVTVESSERGTGIHNAPPGVRPPTYN